MPFDEFSYEQAFSRNVGWVTEWEQDLLRTKKVAIAGMGGVGGAHLMTLTRLGIGQFHVADMDVFETVNFNRQIGASMSTLGSPKAAIMAGMALDVNPTAEIKSFPDGVNPGNIDEFLEGVDLFVDGFDFFVLDIRAKVFARCAELGIPAITAAPVGMGTSYLVFMPGGMTFEQYFGLEGQSVEQQYVNFLVGLTPKALHRSYLVDPSRLDLAAHRAPSTGMACQICAGVTGVEALKILLGRGNVKPAPWFQQFDAYTGRFVSGRLPGGSRHISQRIKRKMGARALKAISAAVSEKPPADPETDMERILDMARWAPSGDNGQPWRFRIDGEESLTVMIERPSEPNIYEYNDGQPTMLSIGHLLETIRVAATRYGRKMEWRYRQSSDAEKRWIEVDLPRSGMDESPLLPFVKHRSVDRSRYFRKVLGARQKAELEAAIGPDFSISFFEGTGDRWNFSRLNAMATDIRLRSKDAYEVHRRVFDWDDRFSATGLPGTALGLDRMTLKLMRWAMTDWSRVERMNLMGTGAASFQVDILPGLFCAAHFVVAWRKTSARIEPEDVLEAGMHLQRFWLTATKLGLSVQPNLAPIAFSHHAASASKSVFEGRTDLLSKARNLVDEVERVTGHELDEVVMTGRIGYPRSRHPTSRSRRRALHDLIIEKI